MKEKFVPRKKTITDAELYAAYERLGSGVLVALEIGMSQSHVSHRLRTYRTDILGVTEKMPRLSRDPRPRLSEWPELVATPEPTEPESESDPASGASVRAVSLRTERRLKAIELGVAEANKLLRMILSRPPMVVEWRPDHTRLKDGGVSAREQRAQVALPRRQKRRVGE